MTGLLHHIRLSLRLYFRNTMALIYGYLFPSIFLAAFWMLYHYDKPPLARHIGELLTVSVLGGACFGLPTTLVSERERGVWRRYRLTPVPTRVLVAGAVVARFVILITAGLLQLGLAMAVGMPWPRHPLELAVAFTFVSFAFLGLGLVIAMMADNVPSVQALGQCIFLPMLIIGGVAVPLASLPDWAQHISAFFPGRYAVEAMQACVTRNGLGAVHFDLFALALIGAAGLVVGAKMFRWDAEQRFRTQAGKGWVVAALASWAAVGVLAETRGHISVFAPAPPAQTATANAAATITAPTVSDNQSKPATAAATSPASTTSAGTETPRTPAANSAQAAPAPAASNARATAPAPSAASASPPVPAPPRAPTPPAAAPGSPPAPGKGDASLPPMPTSWQAVTLKDVDEQFDFSHLPSDSGVVAPIATSNDPPDADVADQLAYVHDALATWAPAKVADPVQRARNELYVAAAPDVLEVPLEAYVPAVVFDRLQQDIPKNDLVKILFWIAVYPDQGDDSAVATLRQLGFGEIPSDLDQVRIRAGLYAAKFLGRLTGHITPK